MTLRVRDTRQNDHDDGVRAARKVIRAAKARMRGQPGDYARGWRAALDEVDYLLRINLVARRIGEPTILAR